MKDNRKGSNLVEYPSGAYIPERDINSIIPYLEICDPYSGYPAYRSVYCTVRRVD